MIGIGAGNECDGQILVLYDILGISTGKIPRFSKNFLLDNYDISAAVKKYVEDVRAGLFPSAEQSFK